MKNFINNIFIFINMLKILFLIDSLKIKFLVILIFYLTLHKTQMNSIFFLLIYKKQLLYFYQDFFYLHFKNFSEFFNKN